jgi:hypothetical protein
MKSPHDAANDAIFLILKPPMHQIKKVVAQASVGREAKVLLNPNHPGMPSNQAVAVWSRRPDPRFSGVRKNLTCNNREKRRLARTRRAVESHNLTGFHRPKWYIKQKGAPSQAQTLGAQRSGSGHV